MTKEKLGATILAATLATLPIRNSYEGLSNVFEYEKGGISYSGRRKSQLTKKQKSKRKKAKAARKARRR